MADTLRLKQEGSKRDPQPDRTLEDSGARSHDERAHKDDRPAGLRLQVFTPPPFDAGPLWGTNADRPAAPQPTAQPPTRSPIRRQMLLAATLAAVGGLLVTGGMLVSKMSVDSAGSTVLSAMPAASVPDAPAASEHAPAASSSARNDVLDAAVPEDLASARPAATMPPAKTAGPEAAESRDAAAPVKDASSGKTLILTDAPF